MKKYLFGKVVILSAVLIIVTVISFILTNISSVDPAEAYVIAHSQIPTEEQIQEVRVEMGLNLPIHQQYFNWLRKAINLDFGTSLRTGNEIVDDIKITLMPTFILVLISMILIIIATISLGMLCAQYPNSIFDHLVRVFNILGMSVPTFWFGYLLLYVFAVKFRFIPVISRGEIESAFLPALTLSVPLIAFNVRLLRSNLLDNVNEDYVLYARARGLAEWRIMTKHVLKNSLAPMITIFAQTFAYLMAGTAIIESVFSWPGMGAYIIKSITARDFPVITVYVLIVAIVFVCSNLLADLINIWMNPKVLNCSGGQNDW